MIFSGDILIGSSGDDSELLSEQPASIAVMTIAVEVNKDFLKVFNYIPPMINLECLL